LPAHRARDRPDTAYGLPNRNDGMDGRITETSAAFKGTNGLRRSGR